ncbi:MAG: hypothetical protein IAG13_20150 [Deltaproteobacteria bacterium]|nr:hypothetical protein [Nannocystaceae bacterium]
MPAAGLLRDFADERAWSPAPHETHHQAIEKQPFVMTRQSTLFNLFPLGLAAMVGACLADASDDEGGNQETEVISTVRLTFTPTGGGTPVIAAFRDPDGDGGVSGTAERLALVDATTYTMTAQFLNELVDPPADITVEVREEAEDHQVFVFGSAVRGPATDENPDALVEHSYADAESDYTDDTGEDLAVGLSSTVTVVATGSAELEVMLRHLPSLNGEPQKVRGLADALAAGGPLPGEVDAHVKFQVTVR